MQESGIKSDHITADEIDILSNNGYTILLFKLLLIMFSSINSIQK